MRLDELRHGIELTGSLILLVIAVGTKDNVRIMLHLKMVAEALSSSRLSRRSAAISTGNMNICFRIERAHQLLKLWMQVSAMGSPFGIHVQEELLALRVLVELRLRGVLSTGRSHT